MAKDKDKKVKSVSLFICPICKTALGSTFGYDEKKNEYTCLKCKTLIDGKMIDNFLVSKQLDSLLTEPPQSEKSVDDEIASILENGPADPMPVVEIKRNPVPAPTPQSVVQGWEAKPPFQISTVRVVREVCWPGPIQYSSNRFTIELVANVFNAEAGAVAGNLAQTAEEFVCMKTDEFRARANYCSDRKPDPAPVPAEVPSQFEQLVEKKLTAFNHQITRSSAEMLVRRDLGIPDPKKEEEEEPAHVPLKHPGPDADMRSSPKPGKRGGKQQGKFCSKCGQDEWAFKEGRSYCFNCFREGQKAKGLWKE